MIATTANRVIKNTAEEVNLRIRRETEERIAYYAAAGPEAIDRRLAELDREWDIERTLETNAAVISLVGLTYGAVGRRRWYVLPALVSGFLLQHALQGWCPPVEVFRRLGFRTSREICRERCALKALRGDFQDVEAAVNEQVQEKAVAALHAADR